MQKRYKKRSELTEKTNMGYPTLADELNIETVNDQLAKVPGFEHMLTYGSKKPRFIDGGGNETLRIESINESVSRITNGMQGLFEVRESKKNITEDDNYPALIDSKKWHAVFKDLVTAINDVSVPYQGEWGNLLSSPDWHLRAYKKMADIFPKLLSLTVKDSSVYEAIKFAEKMVPSYERQVKYVLNKFDNLNNSGSEGFEKLQQLHHDYKSRFIDQIARSRYDESVYLNDKNTLSEIKDPKKRFSIIKKYGLVTESVEEVVDQMMGNTLVMKQIDDMIDGAEAGIRVALSRDNKTAEQFNVLSKKFFEAMKKNDRNAAIQIGNNLVRAGHGAAFGLKESFSGAY